jgi:hypothetical protein
LKRIWHFILFIIITTGFIFPVPTSAQTQLEGWSEDITLTTNENRSIFPAIASWNNNIHVVYHENEGGTGNIDESIIWYVNSSDNGETWNTRIRIDNDPTNAPKPKIAVWEDKIHVIWFEYGDNNIHYTRSLDNGNTWSIELVIATGCYKNGNYDIAVNGSYVHVSYTNIDFKISYLRSEDNGMTWSTTNIIVPTKSGSSQLAMAVEKNNVHIVWADFKRAGISPLGKKVWDIFHIKSDENGVTWNNDTNISRTPINKSRRPDIAVDGDNIYIIYPQQDSNYQRYFSYSRDNGESWTRNIKLTNSSEHVYPPTICAENENLYIVWVDRRDGGFNTYFKHSPDYGETWENSTRITFRIGCNSPQIIADNNWVHVVWGGVKKGAESKIYYKRYKVPIEPIEAVIEIHPDTLNLKSKGKWVTAYIELEEGHNINEINISTILLEDSIPAEHHPTEINDYDNDSIPDLMVKFDRTEVEDMLNPGDNVMLHVSGNFLDGTLFQGETPIRTIYPT